MARYEEGFRRTLLDMHIPDWDPAFLTAYDPVALADTYARAGITSAMLYCKSHVGLCYWPTKTGRMHANIGGRDLVGDLTAELRARDIGVCAYYSVVFDNWAATEHRDWRELTVAGNDYQGFIRYGVCCQNNLEYREYERAQLTDLLSNYAFDALFLDMVFWPLICACDHCRARYRDETGDEIPETVDWTSPAWCSFHAARERWSDEFTEWLFAIATDVQPGLALTHNLAPALMGWTQGQPVLASNHDTFVAGDLYGDRYEQLAVSKLSLHLGQRQPPEFMTSRCTSLSDHERLKPAEEMLTQALAATACGSAFLFIDAVDPIGTINAAVYERIGDVFAQTAPYEPFLGGEPIEDIAVYYSVDSQMDFGDNGTLVASAGAPGEQRQPHISAMRGACRALQRAHLPFGVITRRLLADLDRYKVVVLPNVLRMSTDEIDAFRAYVERGGRVYASGWTSLVTSDGTRHEDFLLADLFGASFEADEGGAFIYVRPRNHDVAEAIAPQRYLSRPIGGTGFSGPKPLCGVPRLVAGAGEVLANLTLPFGYPSRGNVLDQQWASVHSSPPWDDTDTPVIVTNRVGDGRAVYSASDIESTDAEANERLFIALIRGLLDEGPAFEVDAHASVWASAFHQADNELILMTLLAYPADLPPAPTPARVRLRVPDGSRFTKVVSVPAATALRFEVVDDHLEVDVVVDRLMMVQCHYAR